MLTLIPKIHIKNDAFGRLPFLIKGISTNFVIITDKNLSRKAQKLRSILQKTGVRCHALFLPPGEKTKTLPIVERICSALCRFGVKRDGCLIAFGGGVIGDITGFVASIYMRGIAYVAVPTTLLAMCDSSIGGKTGVDLPEGKNMVGSFYHPISIVIDPLLLKTLSEHDFRSGLAEVIKHSVIADKRFFAFLEKNIDRINTRNAAIIEKMIARSVSIKMRFVRADEHESLKKVKRSDSRMTLNYGHTVGHALEQLSNYELPHGYAVAIGMVSENRAAVGKGFLKQQDAIRIESLLKKFHLPTKIPAVYSPRDIKRAIEMDKKTISGKLLCALPAGIGKIRIVQL